MKTKTAENIISSIKEQGWCRPHELSLKLGISPQAIHRQLRKMVDENILTKKGEPPHTVYELTTPVLAQRQNIPKDLLEPIENHFSYLSPQGSLLFGNQAFAAWLNSKNLSKDTLALALAYNKLVADIYRSIEKKPFETTERLKNILLNLAIDSAWISDFYAVPQFGKTKLGNLVHACKTSAPPKLMDILCQTVKQDILNLLKSMNVDTICWVPHSVKRPKPFLPGMRKRLAFDFQEIKVIKIFSGAIPVAQKSLPRLEDRIENARSTLYLEDFRGAPRNILIIDDAIGSGATVNELAKILKKKFNPKHICAYAIVGSYKGFDVISQV